MLSAVALTLGCSGGNADATSSENVRTAFNTLPDGDPTRGAQVFANAGCRVCHMDKPVGPRFSQEQLANFAAARREGYSAELYLYESIVQPRAYIVQGYTGDIMPQNYSKNLSAQDLADLVAYLMTFR
jgi:mono/diheme cytochrome c family protein